MSIPCEVSYQISPILRTKLISQSLQVDYDIASSVTPPIAKQAAQRAALKPIAALNRQVPQILRTSARGHYRASRPFCSWFYCRSINTALDVTYHSKYTKTPITKYSVTKSFQHTMYDSSLLFICWNMGFERETNWGFSCDSLRPLKS